MKILIAGISTRAMAQSAVAAGMDVISLDYFGDCDQPQPARVYALNRDLHRPLDLSALAEEAQKFAPTVDAILIESGLENEPALLKVGKPEQRWFNRAEVVTACRDPRQLANELIGTGMTFPEVILPGEKLPESGRWLVKDRRHSGGVGVREWDGRSSLAPNEILEKYVEGTLMSACFLADGKNALLLGLTRQYAGIRELNAAPFAWCGNVTSTDDRELNTLVFAAIQTLVQIFGLIGLNGMDFIVNPEGPVLLEINPRPPASFELFERLLGVNAFQLQVDGCRGKLPACLPQPADRVARGKGVLYAKQELHIGDTSFWKDLDIADIPHPGEEIPAGVPICTILAADRNSNKCWQRVLKKAEDLKPIN
jgi:uncharacterized protein